MPGLRTKVGTYAAALFLLKDTFKESVDDPDVFEKELLQQKVEVGVPLKWKQLVALNDTNNSNLSNFSFNRPDNFWVSPT